MITIRQIKVEVTKSSNLEIIKKIAKKIKVDFNDISDLVIEKQSLDARDKNEIFYVYECSFKVKNESDVLRKNKGNKDLFKMIDKSYHFDKTGTIKLNKRPVVVGCGPAGLFSALILAEKGYKPLIIERGEQVDKRIEDVNSFWKDGKLNKNSNVQFGEGGAGTFSDGKLNTLIKDVGNRGRKVFNIFVECGAPREILYSYKPHIGTNKLVSVVKNLREKIISLGGEFRFNTCLTNINVEDNKLKSIEVNNNEIIDTEVLVLAIGHSARDTFKMLYDLGIKMESKPFAVGLRVEHKQDMINLSQYGEKYKDILDPATYKLTYKASNNRGVYSFCMCPGGYVVNSSSEEGCLVVNGMSNYERESKNSNSAIVVTVNKEDFGESVLDGVKFQRNLESLAYNSCNGKIPVQTLDGFNNNKIEELKDVKPLVKGRYELADLNKILPKEICDSIKEAFPYFGKKIKGFDKGDTILFGVESRTSSPIRILRDENFISSIEGIYPCGEGCGYAGGITSSAIDGIKVSEKIIEKYC